MPLLNHMSERTLYATDMSTMNAAIIAAVASPEVQAVEDESHPRHWDLSAVGSICFHQIGLTDPDDPAQERYRGVIFALLGLAYHMGEQDGETRVRLENVLRDIHMVDEAAKFTN